MPPRRSLRRVLRVALLGVLALVACALLAEVAVRTYLRLRGRPYSPAETRAEVAQQRDLLARSVPDLDKGRAINADSPLFGILHPYVAWEPESDSGGVLSWFRTQASSGAAPILLLGGSLADDLAHTQAERIARRLESEPCFQGRHVHVLDGADRGHKAPQPLLRAAFVLSSGYRPAAVVLLDGFDELALAADDAFAGTHPLYPTRRGWQLLAERVGAMSPEELDLGLELWSAHKAACAELDALVASPWRTRSALLGQLALARSAALPVELAERAAELERVSRDYNDRRRRSREMSGPPFAADEHSVIEASAIGWSEASRSLAALCAARSIPFVHVLQPALDDPEAKPRGPRERELPPTPDVWRRVIAPGYRRLRELGAELAAAGIGFHDASRMFAGVGDDRFTGPWELGDVGLAELADAIVGALIGRLPGG